MSQISIPNSTEYYFHEKSRNILCLSEMLIGFKIQKQGADCRIDCEKNDIAIKLFMCVVN